mmetsp:Transcript_12672/g.37692  ORF Transcript_12672/g.37692 Transcript_12672/m.37692 type:complete len:484 (-) Transcript_12672:79-1530(-)
MQVHFTTGNPALGADHLHRGSIHLTQAPQSLAERDYGQALPDANLRRATVALVGVPSRFVPTDVVELLAPFRNSVREIRIFRHAEPPRLPPSLCIVTIACSSKQNATEIYARLHGTTHREEHKLAMAFVQQVEWQSRPAPPPDGLCVVCLDRLDVSYHVVLTTACDHSFHAACLGRWSDAPCPVCRYLHASLASQATHCATCALGSEEQKSSDERRDLWVCVVCGFAGCSAGNPQESSHIRDHYDQTKHAYAVSVTSQLVWDFSGRNYVHRLVMDGESVDAADAQEHRKLEGLALEYTQLLRSQLARQRDVYEQRLAARAGGVVDAAAEARVADLRAEVRALERRAARDRKRLEATESDLKFLEEVSSALEGDAAAREADARNAEAELEKAKSDADRLARALEAKLDVAMRRLEAGDDVAPPPAPAAPVAKSIKCVATGKLFPTMAAAQAYAAKTGRTDFEESTEECVPEPPPEDPEDDELYK